MDKLIHKKLSYKLNGILFSVHNELGRFSREKQYCDLLEAKFKALQIKYKREFTIGNSGNRPDFIIDNRIIIEIKAKEFLLEEDFSQVKRYLQITGIKLGLLVNFRSKYLRPRRVLNTYTKHL